MDESSFDTSLPPKPSRHERTRGQRLLLTRDHITQVETLLARTLYVETVAAHMGVHRQTFWQWLRDGSRESLRREDGLESSEKYDLHVELYYVVKKCLAVCEGDYISNVQNSGVENWTANAWLLERRFPGRWSANRGELLAIKKRLDEVEKANAKLIEEAVAKKQATRNTEANDADNPITIEDVK